MFKKKDGTVEAVTIEEKKRAKAEAKAAAKAEKRAAAKKRAEELKEHARVGAANQNVGAKAPAKSFITPMLLAVVLTGVSFGAINHNVSASVEKAPILYAIKSVDKNTYIKAKDYNEYFAVRQIDRTLIPEEAVTNTNQLPAKGVYVERSLAKNQMISENDMSNSDAQLAKYKNGYSKTSIAASAFNNAVNGTIRRGDIIDIYGQKDVEGSDTKKLVKYGDSIYVEEAYTANGEKVVKDDDIATSFTIWVCNDEVDDINNAIINGNLQVYVHTDEKTSGINKTKALDVAPDQTPEEVLRQFNIEAPTSTDGASASETTSETTTSEAATE